MAKNSAKQIEEDEKKILNQLSKNANKSINEIAKNCGFSRQKVWRIIKNLEKNNTIWGYIAVLDVEKQEKKQYFVLIKRSNRPLTKELMDKIIDRELNNKSKNLGVEILSSFYTNGLYDWIIFFNAYDIKGAKRLVEELNNLFEGFIDQIHLIEQMFAAEKCGIVNPEIEKLYEFFF
jgi:DNA-binding Lrp family transcriptional regulator